jgi:hypothetical protein
MHGSDPCVYCPNRKPAPGVWRDGGRECKSVLKKDGDIPYKISTIHMHHADRPEGAIPHSIQVRWDVGSL